MSPAEYRNAKEALGWSHAQMGAVLGRTKRTSFRYAEGSSPVPRAVDLMLRRLVEHRRTMRPLAFETLVDTLAWTS